MKNYIENESDDHEDNILSSDQRSSLLAIQAPANLRGKIQKRIAGLQSSVGSRRPGFIRLTAAGLLGFLSFLGAQALVGQFGEPRIAGLEVSKPPVSEVEKGASVRNYHLQGVALMSTSDRYLGTLGPVGQSPEVVLATYMHQRGEEK